MIKQNDFSDGSSAGPGGDLEVPEILVVDDSEDIRELILLGLRSFNCRIHVAAGGMEARALLQTYVPLLLITDLCMPLGDGWDLISYCQVHLPELPILIISGQAPGARPEIEKGAKGFLKKSFSRTALISQVGRVISESSADVSKYFHPNVVARK